MRSGTSRISRRCFTIRRSWRCAYLDAFQITRDPEFEKVARDILDYVRRDMTGRGWRIFFGGRCRQPSRTGETSEHAEGAFYIWTKKEIDAVARRRRRDFRFSLRRRRRWQRAGRERSAGRISRKNILIQRHSDRGDGEAFRKSERRRFERSLAKAPRNTSWSCARNGRGRISTTRSSPPGTD